MGLSDSKLCGFLLHQTVSSNNINNDNNKRLDPVKSLGEPGCVPKACSQKAGLPPFGLAACPRAVPIPVVSGLSAGLSRLDHPFPSPPAWNLGSPFCTHTQAHHAMSARSCCQGGVCTLSCLRGSLGPENGVSTHSFFCLRSQHLWKTCHEHPACLRGLGAFLYQGHQFLGCPIILSLVTTSVGFNHSHDGLLHLSLFSKTVPLLGIEPLALPRIPSHSRSSVNARLVNDLVLNRTV